MIQRATLVLWFVCNARARLYFRYQQPAFGPQYSSGTLPRLATFHSQLIVEVTEPKVRSPKRQLNTAINSQRARERKRVSHAAKPENNQKRESQPARSESFAMWCVVGRCIGMLSVT